ncbi:hypothetical protein [Streptomyces sp. NPDC088727]|uniref:hypothetical protein n=1 Tax=Streptomyces sp. NPDC088727 TaxID=3365875 RepID=UPI0037F7D979
MSQAEAAQSLGLTIREYAALESGYIPSDIASTLGRLSLSKMDALFGWEEGAAHKTVQQSIGEATPVVRATSDRSTYSRAAWKRLGKAVRAARMALKMPQSALGYAIQSTGKTILRLEEGRIYGDPRTAPLGDYNSEKYVLKRLALLEMALEWEEGQARQILDNTAQ